MTTRRHGGWKTTSYRALPDLTLRLLSRALQDPFDSRPPPLDVSNRGFRILQKMGWTSGTGLGKHEQGMSFSRGCLFLIPDTLLGIRRPIEMKENLMSLGLGKEVIGSLI